MRDLLKSFGWGIGALHQLPTATMVPFPRRLPHTISPLEQRRFELLVHLRRGRFLNTYFRPGLHTVFKNDLLYGAEKLRHLDSVAAVFGSWLPRSDRRCDRYFS
jgi:hypothetical protein